MHTLKVEPLNWELMPNMGEEALEGYSVDDKPMFTEIRDTLLRHDAIHLFGLYLVHKHFDISSDEEMVEHVEFDAQRVTVSPVKRGLLDMDAMVPTNWFFLQNAGGVAAVHVAQWGHRADLTRTEREPLAARYAGCLTEIRDILERGDALDRFGMFLIRNQFDFEFEENQLECTDHDARRLTLTTQLRSTDRDNAIPTNWHFTPTDEVAVNCCECARNSGGHLGYHRGR